jgi:O-antigen/teichoic acid export membrane protein
VFKNVGSTWVLNVLQIAALMVLAPYVVHRLGETENGVWLAIVYYTAYLRQLVLGVPIASVRYTAEHVARKDTAGANRAIATCISICVMLGLVAWLVGGAVYFYFDARSLHGPRSTDLSPEMISGARIAFIIVLLQVGMGFAMRLPYGIFDAHNDFVVRNMVMAGEVALRFALTLTLLHWWPSLPSLALVQMICMLAEFVAMFVIIKRRYPELRLGVRDFDRTLVRSILSYSVFAMILNFGTLLAFYTDGIVIDAFLEKKDITYFDIGNKFFDPLTQFLIAVGAVVMPMATRVKITGDLHELRHVFLKWSKICLSLVLVVGLYLLVLGPEFLGQWVAPDFTERSGRVLQVLMISFIVYLPVRGVALPILLGLGRPAAPAIALLAMGLLNLILSIALITPFGILGVALGTAIPNVVFAGVILAMACKELDVRVGDYVAYVGGRASLGAMVPLALLAAFKYGLHVEARAPLVAAGVAMVIVFALTWIYFVFKDDPYLDLRLELARVLRRAK